MNIAIIDDDSHVRTEVELGIRSYLIAKYPTILAAAKFFSFPNAEEFLADFQPGQFALIFLDIYMAEITGMEAAKRIRHAGDDTPLVFLTTSTEYQLAGYTVFAAGYLMKPLSESHAAFSQVMDHCLPIVLSNLQQLDVVIEHIPMQIPFRNILYLDCSSTRAVQLHLKNRVITTGCSYQDCRDRLLVDQRFAECYHRIIINMDAVSRLDEESFLMADDETIPISRRKKTEVKQRYMNYLLTRTAI